MKKLLLILLCVPLIFSCGEKTEDDTVGNNIENIETDNETGRYQVIEKKVAININPYGFLTYSSNAYAPATYKYNYYLLDTKTGEIKLIDFPTLQGANAGDAGVAEE